MDQATYDRLLAKAQLTRDLFTFDDFIRYWAGDRPDRTALEGDDLTLTNTGEKLEKVIDTGFFYYDKSNMSDPKIAAVLYD